MKATILLSTLFLIATRALDTSKGQAPEYYCTTENGGNIPLISDVLPSVFDLGSKCLPGEKFWDKFQNSDKPVDPQRPDCRIYSSYFTAVLALCSLRSFDAANYEQMAALSCEAAAGAYEKLVRDCTVKGRVRGHIKYSWGSLNVYHAPIVNKSAS